MQYSDSPKTTANYLREALPLLTKHGLPGNPVNYAVYYEYVSGSNYVLRDAINALLKKKQPITAGFCEELYNKYVNACDKKKMENMQDETRRILTDILSSVIKIDDDTSQYSEAIEEYGAQLNEDMDVEDLQRIIKGIIEDTQSIQNSYSGLKTQLAESTSEAERLRKELQTAQKEAVTDSLTQLTNRKGFRKNAEQAIAETSATEGALCLLMIDIDHFKRVNDTYGHPFGDQVLKLVGAILNKIVKGKDTACRFGGEEFAILLPDTPVEGALQLAENIRKNIEKGKITRSKSEDPVGNITVSIGVATYRSGEPLEKFIENADAALYRSKESGRNRVTVS